jgi:O-antigen/teichoic acid export membrane protein
MLRKALAILSGNATTALLLLTRNLIVARMIPVADYGVAATFALAMAMVEMASALGLQQQIVQSRRGDDPHFQAALQGFQVMRGIISGTVLFALAGPLARFMGIPEVIWAYQVLAVVPVLSALAHFDIHRLNRHMRFRPAIVTGLAPAVAALILVWPLAHWLGDWRVMLWSILAQAVVSLVTSHVMAERRYRLILDRAIILDSLRFGWPLLVNGALLFLVFHGDKLIVGRTLGMETLAIFAMGVTLTLTPTLVLERSAQNVFLPRLSTAIHAETTGSDTFLRDTRTAFEVHFMAGNLLVLGTALFGAALVDVLLGEKYAAMKSIVILMAILQALRVFKGGASTTTLAFGKTSNPMIASFVRIAFLPLGYLVAVQTGRIDMIVLIAILAEFCGFLLSFWLAARVPDLSVRPVLAPALSSLAFQGLVLGLYMTGWLDPVAFGVVTTAAFLVTLIFNRQLIFHLFGKFRPA